MCSKTVLNKFQMICFKGNPCYLMETLEICIFQQIRTKKNPVNVQFEHGLPFMVPDSEYKIICLKGKHVIEQKPEP